MRTCCCISADRLYRSEMRSSDMATMRSAACCTPRASPELASSNSVPRLTTSCEIGRNFNLAGFIKGGSKGAHHEIDTRSRGAWLSPAAATDRSAAGGAARPRSTGSARDPAELELQSQRQSGAIGSAIRAKRPPGTRAAAPSSTRPAGGRAHRRASRRGGCPLQSPCRGRLHAPWRSAAGSPPPSRALASIPSGGSPAVIDHDQSRTASFKEQLQSTFSQHVFSCHQSSSRSRRSRAAR